MFGVFKTTANLSDQGSSYYNIYKNNVRLLARSFGIISKEFYEQPENSKMTNCIFLLANIDMTQEHMFIQVSPDYDSADLIFEMEKL